jgi:hypothetical protein
MESSLRGAQRRSNPENMDAQRSPGLLRFARNDDRGSIQTQLALEWRDDRSRALLTLQGLHCLPQRARLGQSASLRRRRRAPQRPAVRPRRLSRHARARFRGDPGSSVHNRADGLRTASCREPAAVRLPAEGPVSWLTDKRQAGRFHRDVFYRYRDERIAKSGGDRQRGDRRRAWTPSVLPSGRAIV